MKKCIIEKDVKRNGFELESLALEYAEKVNGTVRFTPLPDYMAMINYCVVEWEKCE